MNLHSIVTWHTWASGWLTLSGKQRKAAKNAAVWPPEAENLPQKHFILQNALKAIDLMFRECGEVCQADNVKAGPRNTPPPRPTTAWFTQNVSIRSYSVAGWGVSCQSVSPNDSLGRSLCPDPRRCMSAALLRWEGVVQPHPRISRGPDMPLLSST